MVASKAERGKSILYRRGKPVLRGAPIIDREHRYASVLGEEPTGVVVGVEIAHHKATAVEVDKQTAISGTVKRYIETSAQRTGHTADSDLLDAAHGALRPLECKRVGDDLSACVLDT